MTPAASHEPTRPRSSPRFGEAVPTVVGYADAQVASVGPTSPIALGQSRSTKPFQ